MNKDQKQVGSKRGRKSASLGRRKQVQRGPGLEYSRASRASGAGAELGRTGDESFLLLLPFVVSTTA